MDLFKIEVEKYNAELAAYQQKLAAQGGSSQHLQPIAESGPPSQAVSDIMDFDLPSQLDHGDSMLGLDSEMPSEADHTRQPSVADVSY